MALTGQAKTDYQREYMRRRRAGQPAKPEKPAAVPPQELAKELAQAKARIVELEEEIQGLRLHIRFGPKRRAAEPKPAKPPLPPDEERDRIIKGLKTRVRNLTGELHATRDLNTQLALKTGAMNFQTMSAIAKALHPDQQPSEVQRAEACKLFTAWKADNGAAQRKAR